MMLLAFFSTVESPISVKCFCDRDRSDPSAKKKQESTKNECGTTFGRRRKIKAQRTHLNPPVRRRAVRIPPEWRPTKGGFYTDETLGRMRLVTLVSSSAWAECGTGISSSPATRVAPPGVSVRA